MTLLLHSDTVSRVRGVTIRQDAFNDLVRRVRAEYVEMPGLRLSTAQAQRLWSLDAATCTAVLGSLLDDCFLTRTSTGLYRRLDSV